MIEDLIREAGWFETTLPPVAARKMKGWWPEMLVERDDYSWLEKECSKVRCRIRGRADVYDFVMLDLFGAESVLSVREKRVLWARLGLGWSWSKIAKEHHTYRERVKILYDKCLKSLEKIVQEKRKLRKFTFLD